MTVAAPYPYVTVRIDTSGLRAPAARAEGNVAIVGSTGGHGKAVPNSPVLISSIADARKHAAKLNDAGAVTDAGPLYRSLEAALAQDPAPSRLFAVRTEDGGGGPDYAAALNALSAVECNFVSLAEEVGVGQAGPPSTKLLALKNHVETLSKEGKGRLGVAMVDPMLAPPAGTSFAVKAAADYDVLKSDASRMILVAGRVPSEGGHPSIDLAAAAAAAMAGYSSHISVLLKPVSHVKIPIERQFAPSDIKELSEKNIIPVIDPELVPGEGFHLGCGRCFTTDESRLYVDIVRVLDLIDFRLKAGLIGDIGNVRVDRLGMQTLATRIDGILSPLRRRRIIDAYTTYLPLLPILTKEEQARSADEAVELTNSRQTRRVEVFLSVTYGPAVHVLNVNVTLN